MNKATILVSGGALAVMAAAAVGLAFFLLRSDGTSPASSAPAVPTPVQDLASTVEEALGLARDRLTAAPPFVVHDIESVAYVDTTVGRARDLFDPEGETPSDRWFAAAPDDAPVWVVVAHGEFRMKGAPGSTTPGPSYSTAWVVIPKRELGISSGAGSQRFDLSQLGAVEEVGVPLPPFPTPVRLDSH